MNDTLIGAPPVIDGVNHFVGCFILRTDGSNGQESVEVKGLDALLLSQEPQLLAALLGLIIPLV